MGRVREKPRLALRGELRGEAELVPEPADVGPGGACPAGVRRPVLDRTEEELEVGAELRDACGRAHGRRRLDRLQLLAANDPRRLPDRWRAMTR